MKTMDGVEIVPDMTVFTIEGVERHVVEVLGASPWNGNFFDIGEGFVSGGDVFSTRLAAAEAYVVRCRVSLANAEERLETYRRAAGKAVEA